MSALLISVRNVEEARLCLSRRVNILDVKEPRQGSLAAAPPATLTAILDEVASRQIVSAALGELAERPSNTIPPSIDRLTYVKWGLAHCPNDWQDRLDSLRALIEFRSPCHVVVTGYADFRRASAPSPDEVCHYAIHARASALLLDTWHKDGTRLTDWLALSDLSRIIRSCHNAGIRIALAGSLGLRDIAALLPLKPDWLAVRGAACSSGQREQVIDPVALDQLVALVHPAIRAG